MSKPIVLTQHGLAQARRSSVLTIGVKLHPQPVIPAGGGFWYPSPKSKKRKHYASQSHWDKGAVADFCPYKPGDKLWVKERGFWFTLVDGEAYPRGACAGEPLTAYDLQTRDFGPGARTGVFYEADCSVKPAILGDRAWLPASSMPAWASRVDLEVTSVGVSKFWDKGMMRTWEWVLSLRRIR